MAVPDDFNLTVDRKVIVRTLCVVCHGLALYCAWTSRDTISVVFDYVRKLILASPRPLDPRFESRLDQIRSDLCQKLLMVFRIVFFVHFTCIGISGEVRLRGNMFDHLNAGWGWETLVLFWVIAFGIFRFAPAMLPISKTFYLLHVCAVVSSIAASLLTINTTAGDLGASRRAIARLCIAVLVMDVRFTAVVHFLQALAECIIYSQYPIFGSNGIPFYCVQTMAVWVLTTGVCVGTEIWIKEFVASEFMVKDARHNMQRLLSALCDSVIELLPDLRISQATPQLMHLLSPNTPLEANELQGTLFSDLLATEVDKESFKTFLSSTLPLPVDTGLLAEGAAPALRVDLSHRVGSKVSVELFHVHSEGCPGHVIGLREVRRCGAPHEFTFMPESSPSLCPSGAPIGQDFTQVRTSVASTRSCRSSRSRGVASSSQLVASTSDARRQLAGLDRVELALDMDFHILEYNLHFADTNPSSEGAARRRPQKLASCLVGDGAHAFKMWLKDAVNTLLNDDMLGIDYHKEVRFRPPTVACASSKVVLSAAMCELSLSHGEEDDSCGLPNLILQLRQVEHVVLCREQKPLSFLSIRQDRE